MALVLCNPTVTEAPDTTTTRTVTLDDLVKAVMKTPTTVTEAPTTTITTRTATLYDLIETVTSSNDDVHITTPASTPSAAQDEIVEEVLSCMQGQEPIESFPVSIPTGPDASESGNTIESDIPAEVPDKMRPV